MLEKSIEQTFKKLADQDQPQSQISIQQAIRDGRARLRRRRLIGAAGTPAFAAVAALAIGLSSSSLLAGSHGAGPQSTSPASAANAHHFSALSPYATFGWLPAKEPAAPSQQKDLATYNTWGSIDATSETLNNGPWTMTAYAIGACHRAGNQIDCPSDEGLPGQPKVPVHLCGSDVVHAPPVNGRQAYWEHNPDQVTTVKNGLGQSSVSHIRCLTWEYAPGGWASLSNIGVINPDRQLVVQVASKIQFGGRQPSFKFAAQFRNLPGKWRVALPTTFYLMRRVGHELRYMGVEHGALLAEDFTITDGATTLGVDVDVFPSKGQCVTGKPGCRVINGYHVSARGEGSLTPGGRQQFEILAPDADNLHVGLGTVSQQDVGLLFTLFSHMTMLGRNPAAWTTQPVS